LYFQSDKVEEGKLKRKTLLDIVFLLLLASLSHAILGILPDTLSKTAHSEADRTIMPLLASQRIGASTESTYTMPLMKGMTVCAWSAEAYNSTDFDQSIMNLADIKANWALFTVFWFMNTSSDTEIHPRPDLYTASDSSLIHAIQRARELSMKVALKPMVDVVDGTWRGLINPANWTLWFQNYSNFVDYYANLSQANNVELFTVGTELRSSQTYESEWRQVISQIRTRFSGNITYAANWDSYGTKNVKFWDALDYIGVDAYFPLTDLYNPTVEQLISAWSHCTASGWWGTGRNWTNDLYSNYTQTGKRIVFTEIGYYSQDGTNTQPWTGFSPPHQIDLQEQADCYQAALEVFKAKTWFMGWFWWNWETDPDAGGLLDNWYLPQNKPAQNILHQYYEIPPDISVNNVTCSKPAVDRGDIVGINVTLENQGIYPETLNVTVYANSTIIETKEHTVENATSTTVDCTWNTSDFELGSYDISAYAWPLPHETDTADNNYTDGRVLVTIMHDIGVTNVSPSKTVVDQGFCMNVSVTLKNRGYSAETFNLTIYANTTSIASQAVALATNDSTTIVFSWNSSDFAKGNYTLSAYAWPVSGEDETADNNFTDGWVIVAMVGDITGPDGFPEGKCDVRDVALVASIYGMHYPNPNYIPNCDVVYDGKIDVRDVSLVACNYGKKES
jgi:hypothetical protein